jgi:hypothetical protein
MFGFRMEAEGHDALLERIGHAMAAMRAAGGQDVQRRTMR